MPVEVTNHLTPEMQLVSDCREAVKKAEAAVEKAKGELKLAKSLWETAVEELNTAIDSAIDAERQPTLFSRFGGDDLSDPPTPAATPPADPDPAGGGIVDAEYTVNPEGVASLPEAATVAGALPARTVPGWRPLLVADHLPCDEIPARTVDKLLTALGVHVTCGQLADQLVAHGDRSPAPFGLTILEWQAVCEAVELMSDEDDEPVRFGGDEDDEDPTAGGVLPGMGDEDADPEGPTTTPPPAKGGKRPKGKKPAKKGA